MRALFVQKGSDFIYFSRKVRFKQIGYRFEEFEDKLSTEIEACLHCSFAALLCTFPQNKGQKILQEGFDMIFPCYNYFFSFTPSPVMGTKRTGITSRVSIFPDLLTIFFSSWV